MIYRAYERVIADWAGEFAQLRFHQRFLHKDLRKAGLQLARWNAPTGRTLTTAASSASGAPVVEAGEALACRAERGSIFPEAEAVTPDAPRGGAARQGTRRRRLPKPRSATTAAAEMAALPIAAIVESSLAVQVRMRGRGGKN